MDFFTALTAVEPIVAFTTATHIFSTIQLPDFVGQILVDGSAVRARNALSYGSVLANYFRHVNLPLRRPDYVRRQYRSLRPE
jgi:hypothetical protein